MFDAYLRSFPGITCEWWDTVQEGCNTAHWILYIYMYILLHIFDTTVWMLFASVLRACWQLLRYTL